MASVERRKDGRPGYVCRWRDEAGRQRKKSFTRKVDADRYRAEVEHKLNTGQYVDPKAGRTTFEVYAEQWRAMQPHRPNTAARTRSQLTKHVYPAIGGRPLAQLRASELQAFVTGLAVAPSSVRPIWATVRAILSAAVRDRLIPYDPADRIKLPELPRQQITPLTVDQVDQLAAAVPARYRALVVVGAASGLRQGELFGLQVADVDFLRRTLTVERQLQPAAGGGVEVGPLKNRSSYRTLPVGQVVVDALAAHLAAYPAAGAAYVFRDDDGQPLHRNRFNRDVWGPARTAAGLPEVTCHDLRHFFASVLIGAGHNPKAVAERLGHADPAMTLRVYAHLWPEDDDRTRQAIDDVFRRDVPRLRPAMEG
ncbi:tyrosine-type recombinase/integrase [Micromonospora sp. 4G57]|uniref:Tyrosine-type recombinase/integrase n=1 Tax=Micromonospora sicca TaxID=2202420 RepID=A0ABU5JCK6_9ACTN|nr:MULTISPECIES: tyrosine-type recombinase/integrase [unclassified Micromonospora]MDZ5441760.1 tyrosine-type recombinase/integrase [Micromonospora sp. 4G57]MDZ5490321.1 tyrosine-type recombinase/integrase [Micromonospora sp. 4G53]